MDSVWTLPPDAEIRSLLEERVEANGMGMVVGVVDTNGRRVFAHGRSGAGPGRPLDGETVFQLGSVTKPITGLLLADMVVHEEVELDDSAANYLPAGVTMPEASQAITLRDLATHMSGLPSMPYNFDLDGKPDPYESYTVADLWDFLSTHELEREPGSEYGYSNLGVSLLGRLLGLKMGMSYETLVTERVLWPLGMASTSIALSEDQLRRLAPGHGPYRTPVRTWEMATLQASGSLRSTADDMLNLLEAYLGYRETPLAEAMALQLTSGAVRGARRGAISWGILDDGTVRHSGGKAGYRSGAAFNRETGIGAIVLANTRTYASVPIALATHLVSGAPLSPVEDGPAQKPTAAVAPSELDRFAGTYRLESGDVIEIARSGEFLVARYENYSIWEFAPSNETDFYLTSGNDDLTFDIDDTGQVVGVVRFGDGRAEGGGEYARRVEGP